MNNQHKLEKDTIKLSRKRKKIRDENDSFELQIETEARIPLSKHNRTRRKK